MSPDVASDLLIMSSSCLVAAAIVICGVLGERRS